MNSLSFRKGMLAGLLLALALILFGTCLNGCSTLAYATCEERAGRHGTVLECKETLIYQDGQRVTRCLVSTQTGDKFHYYKSCSPENPRSVETYTP